MKEKLVLLLLLPLIIVAVLLEDLFDSPDEDGAWEAPKEVEK